MIRAQADKAAARLAQLRAGNLTAYLQTLPAASVLAAGTEVPCTVPLPPFLGRATVPLLLSKPEALVKQHQMRERELLLGKETAEPMQSAGFDRYWYVSALT